MQKGTGSAGVKLRREPSCVILGGMTLAVSGAAGFVALAQRAVIGRSGSCLSPSTVSIAER